MKCGHFDLSVQSVMSNSLRLHGLQHARLPCPSPTPGACSNSYPLSWWCHPTISSSCPLLLLPSILSSIRVFSIGWFFTSGCQTIGDAASASILPRILRTDFLYDWLVWSPCSPRNSKEYSSTPLFKSISSSVLRFLYSPISHPFMTTGKAIALTRWTFVIKVMSLLFNMLSRLVIAFLPRSKRLLLSWLQSPSAVILEPKKISLSLFPPSPYLFPMRWWDQMPWSLFFECWILSQLFHSPLSLSSRGSLVHLHFLP